MTYSWQTQADGSQLYAAALADGTTMPAGLYQTRRAGAYPTVAEQIDALWKFLEALPPGTLTNLPPDAMAIKAARDGVKTSYPKPDIPAPWVK